ncbi:TetR/AcrR family transcriptional regulator [Ralstonia insidiosa]|jgi:TetR/AcrR family transcriptional repressor of nem operon|uniref:Transcriptional regulator n=1 Tax=Ralstonia insidiosa TaxID=190721 RepID=A0A192A5M5_9RALS|nr:TetR/AcrR family transcriptional regulator [Ralstonia insidiosa]ANJ75689.1 transcriptional regulator [Ralstonia insidiosa]KAB0469515.1 TetR/AcrR family transcriptional regulator [Ralstonia insidiosa]MBY4910202.1 TetR/AcrR family transcriptional regulator [Ralstonia insidiosa]
MRYQPGHKEEKRKALLKATARKVKISGFAATGVDALAQAAGMTSGAFYSHFGSKSDWLKALIESELAASREMWAGNPHDTAQDWLRFELDRYLNLAHVKHPEAGCAVPGLAAEIARADNSVRALYQEEMRKGHAVLAQRLGDDDAAWAMIAQLVGAIHIARAMPDEAMQQVVIEASKRFLQDAVMRLAAKAQP